jgi:hypothetical protein
MKGVKFGEYHSYDAWGLILKEKEIQSPEPKVYQVEVEGGHGVIDMTAFFGSVKYKNRKLFFTFSKPNALPDEFGSLMSNIQNAIHGQKMQIVDDDEPGVFYVGRAQINKWKSKKRIGEIVIEVDAEPFKQRMWETVSTHTVRSNATIVLENNKMPVVPTITTNAEFLISFGGYNDSYSAGTFTIPELELGEGNNQVYVEGTGTITFTYRRGWL